MDDHDLNIPRWQTLHFLAPTYCAPVTSDSSCPGIGRTRLTMKISTTAPTLVFIMISSLLRDIRLAMRLIVKDNSLVYTRE